MTDEGAPVTGLTAADFEVRDKGVRQRVTAAGSVEAVQLGVVLDVSGSMTGERLAIARKATTDLLSHLTRDDRFAIVAFGDQVGRVPSRRHRWPRRRRAWTECGPVARRHCSTAPMPASWRLTPVLDPVVAGDDRRTQQRELAAGQRGDRHGPPPRDGDLPGRRGDRHGLDWLASAHASEPAMPWPCCR